MIIGIFLFDARCGVPVIARFLATRGLAGKSLVKPRYNGLIKNGWAWWLVMSGGKSTIAVLDDESKMRAALGRLLGTHGYTVELFETGEDFLESVQHHLPDCLLLDLHMPRTTGFDVLQAMNSMRIQLPAIVVTGHDEPGNAERAYELGAAAYLLKPLDESILVDAIERICPGSAPQSGQSP
ncbi:MAG: response regulator [Verrucomicrobiota bacterium]